MNLLLVRPDGIGDQILALPVATAARRLLPSARVIFLSSAYAAPILARHPDLDEVRTLEGSESLPGLMRVFQGIDAAIFLKPFRRLMAAAWLARVPVRVGTGYRWYSALLNRRVYEHRSDFARHESEYNVSLLKGLGLTPGEVVPPRLMVLPEEQAWATAFLGQRRGVRVVVHLGGFSSRTWKARQFQDLILHLGAHGYEVLITGTRQEAEQFRAHAAAGEWPDRVRDLTGSLTLRELMAVIAQCAVLVSMSSGPMHLAAALGVPTVSLFDPRRNQSPTRWRPLGRGSLLLPDVPTCEKCIYEACPYWDCLDRITPEMVVGQIRHVVASGELGQTLPLAVARV